MFGDVLVVWNTLPLPTPIPTYSIIKMDRRYKKKKIMVISCENYVNLREIARS